MYKYSFTANTLIPFLLHLLLFPITCLQSADHKLFELFPNYCYVCIKNYIDVSIICLPELTVFAHSK